ncbi:hypothetical protein EJ04DRAFT_548492, partial [Polyplosphaeria fusca]
MFSYISQLLGQSKPKPRLASVATREDGNCNAGFATPSNINMLALPQEVLDLIFHHLWKATPRLSTKRHGIVMYLNYDDSGDESRVRAGLQPWLLTCKAFYNGGLKQLFFKENIKWSISPSASGSRNPCAILAPHRWTDITVDCGPLERWNFGQGTTIVCEKDAFPRLVSDVLHIANVRVRVLRLHFEDCRYWKGEARRVDLNVLENVYLPENLDTLEEFEKLEIVVKRNANWTPHVVGMADGMLREEVCRAGRVVLRSRDWEEKVRVVGSKLYVEYEKP